MAENLKTRVEQRVNGPAAVKAEPDGETIDVGPVAVDEVPEQAAGTAEIVTAPTEQEFAPEIMPVHAAWARTMADVRSVGKQQLHRSQTAGTWRFRGIDDVMNAVGPALRRHGVMVLPDRTQVERRDVTTKGGTMARETTVMVTYRIIGPAGDSLYMTVPGESLDAGDKGGSKAMSVAFRTALLQALCLPTDQPDPDIHAYERETSAPVADPHGDPHGDALAELIAETDGQRLDRKLVGDAFWGRYSNTVADADAGQLRAFVADLRADPARTLAFAVPADADNHKATSR